MHSLRPDSHLPLSSLSSRVSLEVSPRIEALLRTKSLHRRQLPAQCLQASILAAWEERHTQAVWGGEGRDLWSQSPAVCKARLTFPPGNQAEHRVQALALCTAQSSHSQMLGIWSHSGSVVLTGTEALPLSSLQANKEVQPYTQGSNTQQRETTAEETRGLLPKRPTQL